jgi:small nuclear ribonucleoprotein (snRNP)-like protein
MLQSLYAPRPHPPTHLGRTKTEELTRRRVNEDVVVRLKWGATEYHGRLISVDAYMNVQLHGTEEYVNGKSTGTLGQVLIRYVSYFLFYSN